jgi:hypothetical protein
VVRTALEALGTNHSGHHPRPQAGPLFPVHCHVSILIFFFFSCPTPLWGNTDSALACPPALPPFAPGTQLPMAFKGHRNTHPGSHSPVPWTHPLNLPVRLAPLDDGDILKIVSKKEAKKDWQSSSNNGVPA